MPNLENSSDLCGAGTHPKILITTHWRRSRNETITLSLSIYISISYHKLGKIFDHAYWIIESIRERNERSDRERPVATVTDQKVVVVPRRCLRWKTCPGVEHTHSALEWYLFHFRASSSLPVRVEWRVKETNNMRTIETEDGPRMAGRGTAKELRSAWE